LGLVHFLHQNHESLHTVIALTIEYYQHEQAITAAKNHSKKQSQQKATNKQIVAATTKQQQQIINSTNSKIGHLTNYGQNAYFWTFWTF
jgi:hypothetical protein